MKNDLVNATSTASVERMNNIKAIESAAAPMWKTQGVLRTNSTDTAATLLSGKNPQRRASSSLIKRIPRGGAKRRKR